LKEKDLVKGCKKQDNTIQRKVYEIYSAQMRGICYRYTNSQDEGDDILQEGFIKIFTKIDSFKWTKEGSFIFWMRRIMVNTAINSYRKKGRNPEHIAIEVDIEDSSIDEEVEESVFSKTLNNLSKDELLLSLNELSETNRIVFNLYELEGFSHKEISEELQIDVQTSRSRLKRAKQKLQEVLISICKEKMEVES